MGHTFERPFDRCLTRREVLRRGAASGLALGLGGSLLLEKAQAAAEAADVEMGRNYGTIRFFEMSHTPFTNSIAPKIFEKLNPGTKVQVTIGDFATAHDKMLAQFQTGQASFDLVYTWAGWLAEMERFATPLTELGFDVRKSKLYNDMLQTGIETCSLGDKGKERFYGLPKGSLCILLLYNKELLDKAGIKVPQTFPELEEATKELTGKGQYGFGQGLAQGYLLPPFEVFLHIFGARLNDGKGNMVLNSPKGVAALEALKRLYKSSMPRASLEWAFDIDTKKLFNAGKIAMTFDYQSAGRQANTPKQSKVAGKVRSALIPANPPVKTGTATEAIGEGWFIPRGAKNKEGALAFVKFLANPAGMQAEMLRQPSQVYDFFPAYKSTSQRPEFRKDPNLWGLLQNGLYHMRPGHIYSRYNRPFYQRIQDAVEAEVAVALRGKKSSKQALDDAKKKCTSIVEKEHEDYPTYVYRSRYGSG